MAETLFSRLSGIGVASGFKLQAKAPLDARSIVDTIEDRDALIAENAAYEGMKVYVKATRTEYQLKGATTSDWVAFGGTNSTVIAIATKDKAGLVLSSTDNNKISVAEDGTMEVNALDVQKLYIADGDELILFGGNA